MGTKITVLYFEGGSAHPYRILRAHKDRFGSASEIGVFEMKAGGPVEVPNPSALFLAERPLDAPGSAVAAVLNGTRTVLVEIQALVAPTGFGTPRRARHRLQPGGAAGGGAGEEGRAGDPHLRSLRQRGGSPDHRRPGRRSGHHRRPGLLLPRAGHPAAHALLLGEVGLAGEVRAVSQPELRLAEAARLGFERAVVAAANARHADIPRGIEVETVAEALDRVG